MFPGDSHEVVRMVRSLGQKLEDRQLVLFSRRDLRQKTAKLLGVTSAQKLTYIYLETRAASKFRCWSSKTVFHLIAAEISGMRRSLGNKYGFRFWCWNAPFLPMIAPFVPVIAPSLPVQNFHCAVFVELRHVFYIAPFLWTCA